MRERKDKWNYLIQAVSHALEVLEALCNNKEPLGVTELSKQLRLHKNNIFRLLATLEVRGYVMQDASTERYFLGPKALSLASAYESYSAIFRKSESPVNVVRKAVNENVYFATLVGDKVYYINGRESSNPVRTQFKRGYSMDILKSAAGRLLAALQFSNQEIAELKDPEFIKSVEDIKQSHIYVTQSLEKDVLSVAVPVKESQDNLIGAIQVDAPVYRMSAQDLVAAVTKGLTDYYDQTGLRDLSGIAIEVERMNSAIKEQIVVR
jgi:DNA-binding IclR family transcriptional regulator